MGLASGKGIGDPRVGRERKHLDQLVNKKPARDEKLESYRRRLTLSHRLWVPKRIVGGGGAGRREKSPFPGDTQSKKKREADVTLSCPRAEEKRLVLRNRERRGEKQKGAA